MKTNRKKFSVFFLQKIKLEKYTMKRTIRDGDDGEGENIDDDDAHQQQPQEDTAGGGGGPLNESEPCTLSEEFLDKCVDAFEAIDEANGVIREAQQAKTIRLRQCQFLLQTLALDKVKDAILHKHANTAWFIKDISEIAVDPQNDQIVDITSGAKGSIVVRVSLKMGVDRVTLVQDSGMVYIMNPLSGRWRGDILQRHRVFLEGIRNIRNVLLETVKLYISARDDQRDPEKLWETHYRDLITTAKRSYLCKRENEQKSALPSNNNKVPTTATKTKRRREQTPAAGSRASVAANRPTSVMPSPSEVQVTAVNFADDEEDEDAQI